MRPPGSTRWQSGRVAVRRRNRPPATRRPGPGCGPPAPTHGFAPIRVNTASASPTAARAAAYRRRRRSTWPSTSSVCPCSIGWPSRSNRRAAPPSSADRRLDVAPLGPQQRLGPVELGASRRRCGCGSRSPPGPPAIVSSASSSSPIATRPGGEIAVPAQHRRLDQALGLLQVADPAQRLHPAAGVAGAQPHLTRARAGCVRGGSRRAPARRRAGRARRTRRPGRCCRRPARPPRRCTRSVRG